MKTLRPDYYETFHCIADACPITCCQEWKIYVDPDTESLWNTLSVPGDLPDKKVSLTDYLTTREQQRVIALNPDHRCPFLAENKLCHLVLAHGDSVLSETCTVFPRESHTFSSHKEQSLMPCCPAVIDLFQEKETLTFPILPEISDHSEVLLFQIRQEMIRAFTTESSNSDSDSSISCEEILLELFYILRELSRHEHPAPEMIREYFSSANRSALHRAISEIELPLTDTLDEASELLLDLSVNYEKEGLYQEFLSPILLCAQTVFPELSEEELHAHWKDFQKGLSPFQTLFRNFLANELYSDLVLPDYSIKEMLLKLQWIAMEYTAIRQSLFFSWLEHPSLSYERVRQTIVILTRMTGYEDEDIFSYLENSFESPFWDWGYFALIVGRP